MAMMGTKARIFAPIAVVSLEDLVPSKHFYRHLDHVLDLSFLRHLVKETYAHGGRPSIDPVVFFKLQLVMFFEDIRSERLLMQLVADKLSVRWYVGYNLNEPLPDHLSLTRIRERYGVEIFRRFFVEAHLADLFRTQVEGLPEESAQPAQQTEGLSTEPVEREETRLPTPLPVSLSQEEQEALA